MNPRSRIITIILSVIACSIGDALIGQAPFQNPIQLNKRNGLPNNSIRDIIQDEEGFIWIATASGLCRYDGSEIKIFDFTPNDSSKVYTKIIRDLLVDRETGHMWMTTDLGAHIYDPFLGTFQSFVPNAKDSNQLINSRVDYCYQDRQGQLWLGNFTDGLALYRRETQDFERILPSAYFSETDPNKIALLNQVSAGMVQDIKDDHVYWIVCRSGILRWDRNLDQMTLTRPDPDLGWSDELIASTKLIYQHQDGSFILGTWAYGFIHWHPKENSWTRFTSYQNNGQEQLTIFTTQKVMPIDETNVYISSGGNMLIEFNVAQSKIVRTWTGSRKQREQYNLHLIDREGNYWAGYDRGISIYSPLAQNIKLANVPLAGEDDAFKPDGMVWTDEGRVFAGYSLSEGIYEYFPKTNEFKLALVPEQKDLLEYIHDIIVTEDDQIWVFGPSTQKFYRYHPESRRLERITTLDKFGRIRFTKCEKDSRGDIWMGSYEQGIFRFDYAEQKWYHYQEEVETPTEDRHGVWLWGFTEDREGKIWFRTGTGYSVYYPEEDRFANFPYRDGAKNNFQGILDFCLDKEGLLWALGGQEGVGIIDPKYPEKGIIKKFGPSDGMLLNSAGIIVCDDNGDLWLTDYERIARYRYEDKVFEYYDSYYGLPPYDDVLDIEALSSCELKVVEGGQIAIQYRRGLATFHPDSLQRNRNLPRPYISDFVVNDEPYALDSSIIFKKTIKLKPRENKFSFGFSAINFTVPQLSQFRFRLLGHEDKWIEAGDRQYTTYTNLDAGDYTFQVIAGNSDGYWSEQAAELHLSVPAQWHELWLVRAAFFTLLLALVYYVYWRRVQRIREQERQQRSFDRKLANVEMNALRAQMNPHFIFNCLNSIDSFIIRNETHKASEYLNDFARLIRLILQNSRNNLVNLQDELEALGLYLQMEQLRFREKFSYAIEVAPAVNQPATVIPPMLIQPYVENAVWHGLLHKRDGKPGKVIVDINTSSDHLIIEITDNGIGRHKAAELKARRSTPSRKSMGMQITGDRIAMINELYDTSASVETIDLFDEEGKASGTKVLIKIPI